jgi:hypothetical protein
MLQKVAQRLGRRNKTAVKKNAAATKVAAAIDFS